MHLPAVVAGLMWYTTTSTAAAPPPMAVVRASRIGNCHLAQVAGSLRVSNLRPSQCADSNVAVPMVRCHPTTHRRPIPTWDKA